MENFDLLFEKMNENYNYLQTIMGEVYEKVKIDPADESNIQLLEGLGNLAKRMLSTEASFVTSYGTTDDAVILMDKIEDKQAALSRSLEETTMGKSL